MPTSHNDIWRQIASGIGWVFVVVGTIMLIGALSTFNANDEPLTSAVGYWLAAITVGAVGVTIIWIVRRNS